MEVGEELHGAATVTSHMWVPGTSRLRTSVLAAWADNLAGLLAARVMNPRVPVTIELDVHLHAPAPGDGEVRAVARVVKAGRSMFVAEVEFVSGEGEPIAVAGASFMLAPDPAVRLPARLSIDSPASQRRLAVPLAERAGCRREEAGTAVLERSADGLNSSNTVHGGLLALVAEEAVLSLAPGDTVCSLGLRYLQAVRVGPAVASARLDGGLGRVLLRDAGNDDRLSVIATVRTFGR
ncbi:PaaI family thioesterase [Actinomadura algeriensis]|uniref:Acyl-coenzyme A thioesterase PaaI-like protein n=1 Tax=Actinomadura algeriensis TaxID=1679523 RepID=A0ABR9JS50_9ACTN|nr:hotdog domain-containing protein [Actinomadura algeriensis]MBE1533377.1 acyl-coenzyme A thioesterase PaaI-like protein [Actinomadura algeriensis]